MCPHSEYRLTTKLCVGAVVLNVSSKTKNGSAKEVDHSRGLLSVCGVVVRLCVCSVLRASLLKGETGKSQQFGVGGVR